MPLKKTIRLGIGARNSKQNQQAHENDDNAESSFSKHLERGEVSPQQQLPFDDDPELDTIRTLMPITLLCIYASFGIPNQGEIDWQTRTELSAGAHGRISIEIFQKSYLSTYLVNGSGRTSRYDGSQEIVVVKNTITDFAEDPTTPSRDTLAEILYMGASHVLRHENIIDLLGIFWEPDSTGQIIPTLVLEFAPHGSLKDLFLTEPKMTFPEKLAISADICKALQSLHHEAEMWGFPIGLFHGDLKPENIMMFPLNGKEKRYQAKLGDMGSTIIYTPGKTSSHASLGTTGWSAPELKSQSYFDPTAAESFSFGLVFCFIAFDGKAAWELGSIVNYCKANISSPSDATVIAKISALPEDVLLFLIREALQYQDNLQKSEKNLVDPVSTATIRTDPKARCTDFGKLSGMLDADPAEKRQRQPIGNLVDVYATTNSLLTEEGALEIVALASTMPYAFREMIQDRLELVFESLGLKSLYRGHIALLLGVLAFIQPRLKKRNISGQEWFKKAADLGCVTAIPLLARLLPASISGRAKVKRLLTPAVLYDSVFGREDMEESSPETYRQILTEIKKVDIWIGCCRFFNSKDKIISDLLQLTPAGSTGVPDRSGKLSDLLDQISGSVPAQKIRELQVAQFGESLTHYAAGCNDIKLLTTLRKLHAFNSAPTMRGETPAHFACRSGHLEALKLTIEETKGIQLAPDLGGATPLHYLFRFQTEEECNEVARLLLNNGVILEQQSLMSGEALNMSFRPSHATSQPGTALHWAVARNSEVAARVLVRLGANPYLPNQLNRTPWDLAVGARLVKLLRIFETEHRCEIESERREFTRQGLVNNSVAVRLSTGMHHDRRNAETFAFLLESGATTVREILIRLISPGSMDSTLVRPFIEIHKEELSSQPSLVHELLRRAVATCTDSVLQEILPLLHRPIVISEIIYLLLHCNILSRGPPEGTAEVLSSLLRIFGAYSDFDINTKYKCRVDLVESNDFSEISLTLGEGTTLLHQAFSLGRIDLAEILLDHEADPGVLDENGATPLGRMIFAGSQHSNQMLKSLLGTPGMRTPSEFPSSYPEFVLQNYMTLPSRGQNVFHQITRGWESGRVHGSATHSKEALVSLINYFEARNPDLLIKLLNSPDKYGGTPLFYAVKNGYYSAVMLLNKHGADPLIPSDTALEEEVDNRHWDDIFVLESWIDPTGVVAQKLKKVFEERTRLTRQTIKKSIENERLRRLAHEPV